MEYSIISDNVDILLLFRKSTDGYQSESLPSGTGLVGHGTVALDAANV